MSKSSAQGQYTLPKDALSRINLGQSFAEYDKVLIQPGVFVQTPAIKAALDASWSKCFFVGRRGTGKTAITYYLTEKFSRTTIKILPEIFSSLGDYIEVQSFRDPRQRQFKTLVSCFKRALLDEVLNEWNRHHLLSYRDYPPGLSRERNYVENFDFDVRMVTFVEDSFAALNNSNEKEWLKLIKKPKEIQKQMEELRGGDAWDFTLLIDRIDESWDGSDQAVILLMALMHACIELSSEEGCTRPLLFLRENIFERVREIDREFSRLETFVVSLEWSIEMLLELIEKRLNLPFNTKLKLGGTTWDYFFEKIEGQSSRNFVFDFCQGRPRDVLIYCSFAVELAQSKRSQIVSIEHLQASKKRFSDSRLKDLGDEYSENYPQIQIILTRFYGLGREFTLNGVTAFIQKIIIDEDVKQSCKSWIYSYTVPDRFINLLYNIGFFGIKEGINVFFRSLGPQSSTPPAINNATNIVIHPSYVDALGLQDIIIGTLDQNTSLQTSGILNDLPEAINLSEYHDKLRKLQEDLRTLPIGDSGASRYEEIVGDILKLCFFRSLTNVEAKVRDVNGRVIRDWIAANRATGGFWEIIRQRYQSTQIVWECKNYVDLGPDVFHQSGFFMTKEIGYFIVLSYRGDEIKKHYYEHIRRISSEKDGGIILLLTDKDLQVFLRQALNGKVKEDHIQDIYDRTVRMIS